MSKSKRKKGEYEELLKEIEGLRRFSNEEKSESKIHNQLLLQNLLASSTGRAAVLSTEISRLET